MIRSGAGHFCLHGRKAARQLARRLDRRSGPSAVLSGRLFSTIEECLNATEAKATPKESRLAGILKSVAPGVADSMKQSAKPEKESKTKTATKKVESGQIGQLWFSNIFPTKSHRLDCRSAFTHQNHETLIPKLLPEGIEVLDIIPREREGGAFVRFRAPPALVLKLLRSLEEREKAASSKAKTEEPARFVKKGKHDVMKTVTQGIFSYLKNRNVHAFLCPLPIRAHQVLGKPFIEDIRKRYPSARVLITLSKAEPDMNEEKLYHILRPFGRLDNIETLKDGQSFRVSFMYTAAAIAARNCLHMSRTSQFGESLAADASEEAGGVDNAQLRLEYEQFMQKMLRDAVMGNLRLAVPLIVFALLGSLYIVMDPLREMSVQFRLAAATKTSQSHTGVWSVVLSVWQKLNYARQAVVRGRESAAAFVAISGDRSSDDVMEDFWHDRDNELPELKTWLTQPQGRVMLLTGPRGNGQQSLVKYIVDDQAVHVGIGAILEQSAEDSIFLQRFSKAFGYSPVPLAEKHISTLLEMMVPGSSKLGRASENMAQIQRVLSCVTNALLTWREHMSRSKMMAEDAPLFVINGFTSGNVTRYPGLFEALVVWAAYVADAQLARVVFIADNSFGEQAMLAALKNRPEKLDVWELRDAPTLHVRSLVARRVGQDISDGLTDADLLAVGGRFRDVAALILHLEQGDSPAEAVRSLVEAAAMTVRTLLIFKDSDCEWSRTQLWRTVRLFASFSKSTSEGIPYDVFLYQIFRGDEMALRSMRQANLINVVFDADASAGSLRQRRILPGSPLFAEVFRRLVRDEGFAAVLDLEVAKEDIARENKTLGTYEKELVQIQEVDDVRHDKGRGIHDPNEALRTRKVQLLGLILEQQKKVEKFHDARRSAMALVKKSGEAVTAPPAPAP